MPIKGPARKISGHILLVRLNPGRDVGIIRTRNQPGATNVMRDERCTRHYNDGRGVYEIHGIGSMTGSDELF